MSVEGNVQVVQEIDNRKKADVCQEFGVVNCTIEMIWKNITRIISAFEQNRL